MPGTAGGANATSGAYSSRRALESLGDMRSSTKPTRLILAIPALVLAAEPAALGVAVEPCLALINPPAALRDSKVTPRHVRCITGRAEQSVQKRGGQKRGGQGGKRVGQKRVGQ